MSLERLTAAERISSLTESFTRRTSGLRTGDPLGFPGYRDQLASQESDEAVVWGEARIDGADCILVVSEFAFLGGSMGLVVGEEVARAYDAATAEGLALVAVTSSGGARMQEGMVSLVQMAKTAEARRRHAAAGLGQVTIIASPTTGGVYASFGSLGDVILAEPDALVGFAGPRVVRELTGADPPPDVHRSAFAHAHGLVDAIVDRADLPVAIGRALRNLTGTPGTAAPRSADVPGRDEDPDAWERVQRARDPRRPKAPAVLDALLDDATELTGDRMGGGGPDGVIVRLGVLRHSGVRVATIAQDATDDGRILPSGFRKTVRTLEMAGRLGLPVVTVIDTRGADPLPVSEGGGIAAAIARTFVATLSCPSPVVAVVTGEGGSGGALAMAPGDRLVAWQDAIFSVIAPEGAASILHRDGSRAPDLAGQLRLTSRDLVELSIADEIVPEPPGGAQTSPETALAALSAVVARAVDDVLAMPAGERMDARADRWRAAGNRWLG